MPALSLEGQRRERLWVVMRSEHCSAATVVLRLDLSYCIHSLIGGSGGAKLCSPCPLICWLGLPLAEPN